LPIDSASTKNASGIFDVCFVTRLFRRLKPGRLPSGNGVRSVFVCYPREQLARLGELVVFLGTWQIRARGDWDLNVGEPDYQRRIRQLVAGSTAFVALLTDDTRASAPCWQEMQWGIKDN
jgi:hypothetical protein